MIFIVSENQDYLLDGWLGHSLKKKKKLHWVTGPLASLSIECSRQKMQVNKNG